MKEKKEKTILQAARWRLLLSLFSAAVIAAHLLTRGDHALNAWLSEHLVRPAHKAMCTAASRIPFSLAEVLVGVFAATLVIYIIAALIGILKGDRKMTKEDMYLCHAQAQNNTANNT